MDPQSDAARDQYVRQMLGVGRPKSASKRVVAMIDGLIQAARWEVERPQAAGHWAAQVKDRRKALVRYLGRMEHEEEEVLLLNEIERQARLLDTNPRAPLSEALHQLEEYRARKEDESAG